jgi:DNA/RNA-binding domain of Phe-tRNA-synthetase-like protein
MNVYLSPEVADRVAAGIVELSGLKVHRENSRWSVVEDLCRSLRKEYGHVVVSQVPGVEWARRLYSSVGIDPTKHRPSSEALLRRALKGEPLHQVNTLVDAINWCSLEFLLPIGLHDAERIEGDVTLRMGRGEEAYEGIGKGIVHIAGRLTVADSRGPFGSPTSDSYRTSITTGTTRALAILYAPAAYDSDDLAEAVEVLAERAQSWCGGEVERTDILRSA